MTSALPSRLTSSSRTGSVRGCLKTVGWNLQWTFTVKVGSIHLSSGR